MALDSVSKRMSAINVGCPWRSSLPIPDNAINQSDRQHVSLMYTGIPAGAGAVSGIVVPDASIRIGTHIAVGNYGYW